ncbi:uncharacterized protein LOC127857169 isoform X2 [Dreissena polymorpha]|uniref:uncharacterized protein LOC127857169 isoform X2 n=1 Tax=Dreissena polymorpha TaxID=45954 RepID=UPI0022652741|nr:uncharacterized protein LOC127857169 isoform X2 [Dreissena polymorpha]
MQGKSALNFCGVIFGVLATIVHVIGLSSPYWLESFEAARSRFVRLGLWTACFDEFTYDRDQLGMTYDGCGWIYSYDYKPMMGWLVPAWLLTVQVMMTSALIVLCLVSLALLGGQCHMCASKHDILNQAMKAGAMWISCKTFLVALISASVTLFGIKYDKDRQWFPRPDQIFLSWSFGLVVVGGFFAVFSAMCLTFDVLRLSDEAEKKQRKATELKMYRIENPK